MGLRVATFNLRGAIYPDGVNAWWLRRHLVAEVLQWLRADVWLFQEVMAPQARWLRRRLTGYGWRPGLPTGRRTPPHALNAVAWRRSRVQVVGAGAFWVAEDPARRRRGWGARYVRAAQWVRAETQVGRVVVGNCHLDHVSAEARREGAALVGRRIAEAAGGSAAVLGGDFNASPGSAPHRALLDTGWRDAWTAAGRTEDAGAFTFHDFRGRRVEAETRIDWLLHAGPLSVVRADILRTARPPRFPSDHFPVWADYSRDGAGGATPGIRRADRLS